MPNHFENFLGPLIHHPMVSLQVIGLVESPFSIFIFVHGISLRFSTTIMWSINVSSSKPHSPDLDMQGRIQGEEWGGTKAKKKKMGGTGIKKKIQPKFFFFGIGGGGGTMATTGPPQIRRCRYAS
jgi:hypothetical protein